MLAVLLVLLALAPPRPPNIVLVLADDLGSGDLGCTGSVRIDTPEIDRLRDEGMLFAAAYASSPVCAPSRASLLTGRSLLHAPIRDNREVADLPDGTFGGQAALPAGTETLAAILRRAGYATAVIGKWGLGGPGEPEGHPLEHGFDRFFGYLCQRDAHNFHPVSLWRDRARVPLEGNARKETGPIYAPDLFAEEGLAFIDAERDRPFFLLFATTVPHLALQAPEESVAPYRARFAALGLDDPPYDGGRGYLPCPAPRATYAAMVSRFDRDVGRIVRRIDELGLGPDTLVIVTSDNGATFAVGGFDPAFFRSNGDLRGAKGSLWEGGIRVPFVARRPGRVAAGATAGTPIVLYDLFPTFLGLAGVAPEVAFDGVDLAPLLRGEDLGARPPIAWEHPAGKGQQAVRDGKWKLLRRNLRGPEAATAELFDLEADPGERFDRAAEHPEIVARLQATLDARTPSERAEWNFPSVAEAKAEPDAGTLRSP